MYDSHTSTIYESSCNCSLTGTGFTDSSKSNDNTKPYNTKTHKIIIHLKTHVVLSMEKIKGGVLKNEFSKMDAFHEYISFGTHFSFDSMNNHDIFNIPICLKANYVMDHDTGCNSALVYIPQANRFSRNIAYSGKPIIELIRGAVVLRTMMDSGLLSFDESLIKISTSDIYDTTTEKCIHELITSCEDITHNLRNIFSEHDILSSYGLVRLQDYNYCVVKYFDDPIHYFSFSPGASYNIFLMLPTDLNLTGVPKNMNEFIEQHNNAIRAIQWIEPLMIAVYGTPDLLSVFDPSFSKGSKRNSIGSESCPGSYDSTKEYSTDTTTDMPSWFHQYHTNTGYVVNTVFGLDIILRKTKCYGIEIRFMDHVLPSHMYNIINIILLLCQHALTNPVSNPVTNTTWNDAILRALRDGHEMRLCHEYINCINKEFEMELSSSSLIDFFGIFSDNIFYRYHKSDFIRNASPNMLRPIIVNVNEYMHQMLKQSIHKTNTMRHKSKRKHDSCLVL